MKLRKLLKYICAAQEIKILNEKDEILFVGLACRTLEKDNIDLFEMRVFDILISTNQPDRISIYVSKKKRIIKRCV